VSGPHDDRTVEQPAAGPETAEQPAVEQPSVRTAPPPSRIQRWWASVPPHIGPARTSTVVLAVLFLALGSLYLTVRPEPVPVVAVQTTTPATTTARPVVPTTRTPTATTTRAATSTAEPTTAPTSGPTTAAPSETTTSETSTDTAVPTTEVPTTAPTTTETPAPTS
jgi:hypothetical protein